MSLELNDLHTRLAVAETEIKAAKLSLTELEHNFATISQGLFELREITAKQASVLPLMTEKIEKMSEYMSYNVKKTDASHEKILSKFESFETSFNKHMAANAVTNMKVKIMWGAIVFLLTSAGALLTQVIKSKILF